MHFYTIKYFNFEAYEKLHNLWAFLTLYFNPMIIVITCNEISAVCTFGFREREFLCLPLTTDDPSNLVDGIGGVEH